MTMGGIHVCKLGVPWVLRACVREGRGFHKTQLFLPGPRSLIILTSPIRGPSRLDLPILALGLVRLRPAIPVMSVLPMQRLRYPWSLAALQQSRMASLANPIVPGLQGC